MPQTLKEKAKKYICQKKTVFCINDSMINVDVFDIMGLLGVILNLYAYARLQWQREYAKQIGYSLVNFVGALLLIASLLNKWNLASFTGNLVWAFISLYGIYHCIKYVRYREEMSKSTLTDQAASKP